MAAHRKLGRVFWIASVACAFALGFYGNRLKAAPRSPAAMREAVRAALSEPDTTVSLGRIADAASALTPENLPAAIEALEGQLTTADDAAVSLLCAAWARIDAPDAFRRVDKDWPHRWPRTVALREIVEVWALREPVAAMRAVDELPHSEWGAKEESIQRLVRSWARTDDVAGATSYVASLVPSSFRRELVEGIARERLARAGAEGLMRWAESIPDDAHANFKRIAFRAAAQQLAQSDPVAASAWVQKQVGRDYALDGPRVLAAAGTASKPGSSVGSAPIQPDDGATRSVAAPADDGPDPRIRTHREPGPTVPGA